MTWENWLKHSYLNDFAKGKKTLEARVFRSSNETIRPYCALRPCGRCSKTAFIPSQLLTKNQISLFRVYDMPSLTFVTGLESTGREWLEVDHWIF